MKEAMNMIHEKIHRWEGIKPFDKYEARDRRIIDERTLDELIIWLEYELTTGGVATRNSCKQEQNWAHLLRTLLFQRSFSNLMLNKKTRVFRIRCNDCCMMVIGSFEIDMKLACGNLKIELSMKCNCAERRIHDLEYHIEHLLLDDGSD